MRVHVHVLLPFMPTQKSAEAFAAVDKEQTVADKVVKMLQKDLTTVVQGRLAQLAETTPFLPPPTCMIAIVVGPCG